MKRATIVALAGLVAAGIPLSAQVVVAPSPGAVVPVLALAFVGFATPGAAVSAQPAESTIVQGRWVLAFALPSGGGSSLSVGRVVAPRVNLGLEVSLSRSSNSEADSNTVGVNAFVSSIDGWSMRLGPSLRWYQSIQPTVAPFLMVAGGVSAAHATQTSSTLTPTGTSSFTTVSDDHGLFGRLAYGVEWVPLRPVSIAGWVGAEWTHTTTDGTASNGTRHASSSGLRTLVSALTLQVYF